MDLSQDAAKLFLGNEVRKSIKDLRSIIFVLVDSLRTEDADNFAHLCSILRDDELAKKFSIFPEMKSKAIRKQILDSTNNAERRLLEYMENFDIEFKPDTKLEGLFNKGQG